MCNETCATGPLHRDECKFFQDRDFRPGQSIARSHFYTYPHSYPSGSYGTGHILLPKLSIFSIKAHSYGMHLPLQTAVLRSQFTQHYLVHRNTASLLYLFSFKYFRTFNSSIYKGHKQSKQKFPMKSLVDQMGQLTLQEAYFNSNGRSPVYFKAIFGIDNFSRTRTQNVRVEGH